MTWTKLGDEFPDEAATLSDQAFRLHVEALCWANRRELDLRVPKRDLRRFYNGDLDDADVYVNELLGRGWWVEQGDCWDLVRFAEWQIEKAQLEHRREQNKLIQRRRRRHALGDHSLCKHTLSPDDSPGDSRSDDARDGVSDPGRDGTGLEDLTPLGLEELQDPGPERDVGTAPLDTDEAKLAFVFAPKRVAS